MTRALHGHERLRSALRVAVALCGLLIYFGDPSEHPSRRPLATAVLILFLVYALVLHLRARRGRFLPGPAGAWIDLGWVTVLVAASQATSSIFFPLYLFPILYASFGSGFRAGMTITIAAAASFALVGAATAPRGTGLVSAFVTRPLYLLLLGYLTSVWGEHEVRSRARLALLRAVTSLSNPRFGIDRTVQRFLEAVRRFYEADACRLVVEQQGTPPWVRTSAPDSPEAADAVTLPPELGRILLPDLPAVAVHAGGRGGGELAVEVLEPDAPALSGEARAAAAALAEALEAGSLLSVPFRYHATAAGRLHVARARPRRFDPGEIEFARHLLDQVVPVLENLRLVDRLASDAAEEERRRIARDLHDSVIQPYLGLRLGLSAVQSAIGAGRLEEGRADLARLVALADGEIRTLRDYVRGLREGAPGAGAGLLEEGVRRFCSRFAEATGIRVEVTTEGAPVRNDRLAAEVFQMVAEALSNVRRHSSAERVAVRIRSSEGRLHLTVSNDGAPPGSDGFSPRSLGERAAALGGSVRVERPSAGETSVEVQIPL